MPTERHQYRVVQRGALGGVERTIVVVDGRRDDGQSERHREHFAAVAPAWLDTIVEWRAIATSDWAADGPPAVTFSTPKREDTA
jgi:hypothetical protein